MDVAFIAMLFMTSLTGMALLLLRDTAAMGPLLALHLGVVFALFLTMPYGKFVHGIYRYVALVRYAQERQHILTSSPRRRGPIASVSGVLRKVPATCGSHRRIMIGCGYGSPPSRGTTTSYKSTTT